MPRELRLQGKKALVTGSDTGIGHEIGIEFARQGADVVFHYVQSDAGVRAAVDEVKSMGRKSTAFQADFDVLGQVTRLADQAGEFLGGINCLVNNAGVTMNRPFLKVTPEQFDKLFHINFRGQFFLTQRIVEDMLQKGGGVICNMSSVHGLQGVPEHTAYAATKGVGLSRHPCERHRARLGNGGELFQVHPGLHGRSGERSRIQSDSSCALR
jgi:NAD(P)-dependent dehydrogenase (short-subunit alcohol dehydrogenase family)